MLNEAHDAAIDDGAAITIERASTIDGPFYLNICRVTRIQVQSSVEFLPRLTVVHDMATI